MRLHSLVLMGFLGLLSGCQIGVLPKDFPAAQSPSGAMVTYTLKGGRDQWRGELFAVDSTHAYIYQSMLYRVRWDRISRIALDGGPSSYVFYSPADQSERQRLSAVSRFPQGLDGPLLARVLQQLEQQRVEERP